MAEAATGSNRIKFVYNAQFPTATAIVLDYLLNNPHFTSRQGRQKGMDAITAFYRPLAEEARGELTEEQVREVAKHCVELLSKHIDALCSRYQLDRSSSASPMDTSTATMGGLQEILMSGFQTIADAIRSQVIVAAPQMPSAEITTDSQAIEPAASLFDLEQGIAMDKSELGLLGMLLDDTEDNVVD
jgi:hypothetical protein